MCDCHIRTYGVAMCDCHIRMELQCMTVSLFSYLKIKLHANGKGEIPLKR